MLWGSAHAHVYGNQHWVSFSITLDLTFGDRVCLNLETINLERMTGQQAPEQPISNASTLRLQHTLLYLLSM